MTFSPLFQPWPLLDQFGRHLVALADDLQRLYLERTDDGMWKCNVTTRPYPDRQIYSVNQVARTPWEALWGASSQLARHLQAHPRKPKERPHG